MGTTRMMLMIIGKLVSSFGITIASAGGGCHPLGDVYVGMDYN